MAIDQHPAGTALVQPAAETGAGKFETVAKDEEKGLVIGGGDGDGSGVEGEGMGGFGRAWHFAPPSEH
jgi:hypothetical protein